MPFEPIRRIIPKAIQEANIAPQLNAVRVLEVFQQVLVGLWGEEKAGFITPISFQQGELKVKGTAAAALQELRTYLPQILNELNRGLGQRVVRKIKLMDG